MNAGHFEREAKIMAWIFPALVLLALIGGVFISWLMKQVAIDKCLDSGGAFDYKAQTCIYEKKRD